MGRVISQWRASRFKVFGAPHDLWIQESLVCLFYRLIYRSQKSYRFWILVFIFKKVLRCQSNSLVTTRHHHFLQDSKKLAKRSFLMPEKFPILVRRVQLSKTTNRALPEAWNRLQFSLSKSQKHQATKMRHGPETVNQLQTSCIGEPTNPTSTVPPGKRKKQCTWCPAAGREPDGSTLKSTPQAKVSSTIPTASTRLASLQIRNPKSTPTISGRTLTCQDLRLLTSSKRPTLTSSPSKFPLLILNSQKQDASLKVGKTLESATVDSVSPEGGLQWAGGHHMRQTFHKKKDNIVNWTEVLFRNWIFRPHRFKLSV